MKKKISTLSKKESPTLHGLLGSISYWGTATRFLLVSMLVFIAFVLNISLIDVSSPYYVIGEAQVLIYALGILILTDLLYVMVARSKPLDQKLDRWVVILADIVIASCFIVPSFVSVAAVHATGLRVLSPIVALLVVGIRVLLGLLYSKKEGK
ncbi:hypothetical protein EOM57_00625 [Candidatus Saccharibacteria bacterium]|nr:hypothetical protein [Candidatus Saccharibacteria bacterium]